MRYEEKAWADSMRISFDYNGMMQSSVGMHGLCDSDLCETEDVKRAISAMREHRHDMEWRELPYTDDAIIDDILKTAEDIRENYDAFVVLGIGGSALGPVAVHRALCHLYHNEVSGNIKFYVEDNADPEILNALLDVINPKRTVFNVITKSGSTCETVSQLIIITDVLKKHLGDDFAKNIIATTDKENGSLIKIARRCGMKTFVIPKGVGGRFSELSPVGLLPAAVCGIDIRELLAGAAYMDGLISNSKLHMNPAYMSGLLQVRAMEKGCNIHVFMPYSERLRYVSDWYAQLWAESLGKAKDRTGKTVNMGQTPVKALGVTDQHSQVQLYTEGPFDKVITFVGVGKFGRDMNIPHEYEDIPDAEYLCGHTQGELMRVEQLATEYAVTQSGHMNNTITLPEINAFTVGQLLYMLEVQTAFAGELLNIDAFNQPGVEAGKNATYARLGKAGYEKKNAELESVVKRSEKYIVN